VDVNATTIRLFLHLLAVCVWVGGQLTLAGLLPALRAAGGDVPKQVARQFNRVAWPFFGLAVATGIWNLTEVGVADRSTGYQVALFVKLVIVALSGVGAWAHSTATRRSTLAVWGAVSGVTSLAALLFGAILITTT
jgi:putative copper export protein